MGTILALALMALIWWVWTALSSDEPTKEKRFAEANRSTADASKGFLAFLLFCLLVTAVVGGVLTALGIVLSAFR
jgi:hypothetical protein